MSEKLETYRQLARHTELENARLGKLTESLRAQVASLEERLRENAKDWAITDASIRNTAMRVLSDFEVRGDSHGVPPVEDIVELLVDRISILTTEKDALTNALKVIKDAPGGGPSRRIAIQALDKFKDKP